MLFGFIINAMGKKINVLHTCGDSVAMATISLVMFGIIVYEYPQCGNTHECTTMQNFVNIRCRLETFQGLSTNFGDKSMYFWVMNGLKLIQLLNLMV